MLYELLSCSHHKLGCGTMSFTGTGALFNSSCLKREMESYIYFANTISCLFSSSLQQLKCHSPSFWQATAFLRMHSMGLPFPYYIFTSTLKQLSWGFCVLSFVLIYLIMLFQLLPPRLQSWSINFIAFQAKSTPISGSLGEIWLRRKGVEQAVCSLRSPSPFIPWQGNIK